MQMSVDYYSRYGHKKVAGWLEPDAIRLVRELAEYQRTSGVSGNIAEIGVHHGRLFLLLHLLRAPGERSLAVDIFDDQHLNRDDSGCGNRAVFESNLHRHADGLIDVVVLNSDSLEIDGKRVRKALDGEVRLFSVDGGHTPELTLHDLTTAQESLTNGGIVLLDDCFNGAWPGVAEGAWRYLGTTNRNLVPFAIGFNKTLFTAPEWAARYADAVERLAVYHDFRSRRSEMGGHAVVIVESKAQRGTLRRLLGPMLKGNGGLTVKRSSGVLPNTDPDDTTM
jgi:hypothetical protein